MLIDHRAFHLANLNSSILVRRRTEAYCDLHLKGKRKQTKNSGIGQDVRGDVERS